MRRLEEHRAQRLVFALPSAQSTPTLTRGPRPHQSASMGQPIGNLRRQGALQTLRARVGSGTVAVITSTPMTPAAL
jgi:hypothetical protein